MASKGFKKVQNSNNNARWDDPIKEEQITIDMKPKVLRFFPTLVEVKTHYIEFMSESKGKTGFPVLCVAWDPVEEKPTGRECPWCAEQKSYKDKNGNIKQKARFYQSSAFYGVAFDRGIQKKTKDTVVAFVRMTKTLAEKMKTLSASKYNPDMLEESQIEEMGIDVNDLDTIPDVTDEKFGFNVSVYKTNKSGKVDYEANPLDTAALSKKEQELYEAFIARFDIGKMAAAAIKAEKNSSIEASLDRLRDKFLVQEGDVVEDAPKSKPKAPAGGASGKSSARMERIADDDDEDEGRTSLTGGKDDDDDDGDSVPAATPKKPAPAAAPKSNKNRYAVDDDDDEGTQSMSTPDADDAPDDDDDE